MNLGQSVAAGDATPVEHGATTVVLRVPADRRYRAVGRLVAGGLATRVGLDVDEIDDLRLALETLMQQPPASDSLIVSMAESGQALGLTVGPFASAGAEPPRSEPASLERVLGPLVDDFLVRESEQGEWFAVRVSRRPGARGSR